ncbi:hypothetical protein Y958_20985 [Nitrospirillum viridazoti CBAmc]|uniref:Uncharacterized protein n=2 Tax=Nitrospirillum TaxID=1543705 RepID=A0A248JX53_9PROT|nr:hypothetical protein Y958_20985 [Nitrospirillum amazonense CBAmc]
MGPLGGDVWDGAIIACAARPRPGFTPSRRQPGREQAGHLARQGLGRRPIGFGAFAAARAPTGPFMSARERLAAG